MENAELKETIEDYTLRMLNQPTTTVIFAKSFSNHIDRFAEGLPEGAPAIKVQNHERLILDSGYTVKVIPPKRAFTCGLDFDAWAMVRDDLTTEEIEFFEETVLTNNASRVG